jgi:hypothetical protein
MPHHGRAVANTRRNECSDGEGQDFEDCLCVFKRQLSDLPSRLGMRRRAIRKIEYSGSYVQRTPSPCVSIARIGLTLR